MKKQLPLNHLERNGRWLVNPSARCLTVDVASVVWDLFLLDGEASCMVSTESMGHTGSSCWFTMIAMLWPCYDYVMFEPDCFNMTNCEAEKNPREGGSVLHCHCDPSNSGAINCGFGQLLLLFATAIFVNLCGADTKGSLALEMFGIRPTNISKWDQMSCNKIGYTWNTSVIFVANFWSFGFYNRSRPLARGTLGGSLATPWWPPWTQSSAWADGNKPLS